jgi:hypothetical protein
LLRCHREAAGRRWRRQRGLGRPALSAELADLVIRSVARTTARGGACASRASCKRSASTSRQTRFAECFAVRD